MKDINGVEIEVGDLVRTQQKPGGILPPGPAREGIVVEIPAPYKVDDREKCLGVLFGSVGGGQWKRVCLHGQINEVVKKAHKPEPL